MYAYKYNVIIPYSFFCLPYVHTYLYEYGYESGTIYPS